MLSKISITELKDSDIGKWVCYTGGAGETEDGKIKSWNDDYIFVVYKCAGNWDRFQDYTGVATNPKDIKFI